jgi:uncharacterized membrane protein YfcA
LCFPKKEIALKRIFQTSQKKQNMDLTTVLILALIGLAAGTMGGMVGLGGGLIIVPAMIYFLGVDQKTAQGTSIAIMLPPIGLFAAINYYKAGYINVKYAGIIAVTFLLGGYVGSKLAIALPDAIVKKVFAALMIITAIKMIFSK